MNGAVLGVIGVIGSALIAAAAVVIAARLGKKGAERTVAVQERQAAADERVTLLAPYTQSLTDLRRELDAQRTDADRARERITVLERGQEELNDRLERTDYRYREALEFIRRFRAWVSERMPGVHDAPTIPPALEADLEEGN